jgi:hypothetical protein
MCFERKEKWTDINFLIFISATLISVRESARTGSPGNCCGEKRQQKSDINHIRG